MTFRVGQRVYVDEGDSIGQIEYEGRIVEVGDTFLKVRDGNRVRTCDRFMAEPICPEPEGTRIRLTKMDNDPDPIPVGTTGTVTGGSETQMWVAWDNGRSLNLMLPDDEYEVIS